VIVGAWRFGLDLQLVRWSSVRPTGCPDIGCIGYAIASVLPYMLTVIITQAIVVFVFMFSP